MARYKSVYDEKTGTLKQVPQDNAAKMEVLEREAREGVIGFDVYQKRKADLEKLISDEKAADAKSQEAAQKKQAGEREAVLKVSADRKKAALDASAKRATDKAKRKEVK